MVMFALGSSAWAQTAVEFTFYDPGVSDGPYTQTKSGVTLTCYAYNFVWGQEYACANLYGNDPTGAYAIKVSSANPIVKVEFTRSTLDNNKNGGGLNNYAEANGKGAMTATAKAQATWEGEETALTFVAGEMDDTFLDKIVVYVDGEVEEEEPPFEGDIYDFTFDPDNISWTQGDVTAKFSTSGAQNRRPVPFVLGSNCPATFSVPAGRKMVKIEFTKNVQQSGNDPLIPSVGSFDDATATWTDAEGQQKVTFTTAQWTYSINAAKVYVIGEATGEDEDPEGGGDEPIEGGIVCDFDFTAGNPYSSSWANGNVSATADYQPMAGTAFAAHTLCIPITSDKGLTFTAADGYKIVAAEFTKADVSGDATATVGTFNKDYTKWTCTDGTKTVTFNSTSTYYVLTAKVTIVEGEAEEEEPEGLKEGNFYIYANDWSGNKIYLAPNADGTLGMVAFDDAADKTAYQWTLTSKEVEGKFSSSYWDNTAYKTIYTDESRTVEGYLIKNIKTGQYIAKGAYYDNSPYWRIALTSNEADAHVYYAEEKDGLYYLYDTDAPTAVEAFGESEYYSPLDFYGYVTTSGLSDYASYNWIFAAVDAYNPADKDVFIASLDENNKPQYFVTVSGGKAVADPNYEYDSYNSVPEFALHQTETGYQLLSGGKYVAADGTISDAACEYTLTDGILSNGTTAAWFILDKNGEELSTYNNNKWSKSELESALQAVEDAAIDRTKYPEALLKELDDAVAAAQNLNQFYDNYSNLASAIKSALTKIAEYVEGTYQVAPAAGFQGYIANGGYAGYYMAYVDGEVKAVQFDESKADNFVWEIEANGDNLYIKHAATGKYLGGVHHYNCTGFGHTDAQGGYTEWAPRHAPDFGDLAQAHAYTFPTNSYYDWMKPGYIDGYAIADGDPCYLPGYVGYGDNHFPYATIMDDNGEPNGVIYGENSMNNQKSSVWKFLQLEAPVALTPEVVANNVPEEAVARLMSVELTYNTEVKVADKTLVTFTDAKGQTIDGVSASIMSPTGKGADFKKIIVGFVGLENLASGTYTVTLAEGAVANRADDTKVAKAYSFSFTLDVPLPEYKTFALKSSTPANGATVQNITEATLVFDGNIGEITNAAAAVLTKDGVSAGNTYMEVATDVAGTITVAFDEALAAGTYTLTIPAETIWNEKYNAADANKGIYAGARCNDEIVITFTVEKADGINGLLLDGNAELYNLNGVRANANAKGVVVGKGIKVLRK